MVDHVQHVKRRASQKYENTCSKVFPLAGELSVVVTIEIDD